MEKKSYLKPEINSFKFESSHFIALSGNQTGEGGTTCSEFITDTILEELFRISTESDERGAVDTAKLKCYLENNNLTINVGTDWRSNNISSDSGIIVENGYANIGGLSFISGGCYKISVVNGCFHFEQSTGCSNKAWHEDLTNFNCNN